MSQTPSAAMPTYASNATAPQIAKRLLASARVLVTTHVKPDGDAMGATLALARALEQKGKVAEVYLMGPIEPSLILIAGRTPFRLVEREEPGDQYDVAVVLDTGAWSQLEPLAPWLRQRHDKVIVIDHHPRGDDVGSMKLIAPSAVSTTAVLVRVLDELGAAITGGIGGVAEALFVGLATDSGWFRYGNAGVEAFELAARLLRAGVDKSRIYQIIEENHSPRRLAMEARALASLEFVRHGAYAIQTLRMEDFQAVGGGLEDLTGLVNAPMVVGAVRVSILFSQSEPGITKISFRSKPPPPELMSDGAISGFVDVNALAQQFGGGGHVHAAGARLKMNIDEAKAKVLAAIGG